ncbi:MAG: DUF819 family protein [Paludibacteraceae bacterium]|nr:DUF819 family protein [Paludibacteraceae bacterium]
MICNLLISNPRIWRVVLLLALYIVIPIVIITIFKHKRWMQRFGTVIAAYTAGLLMAVTGITHFPADSMEEMYFSSWQSSLMSFSVVVAIPLLLFNCDFRLWTRALPKTILALLSGLVAVVLTVIICYRLALTSMPQTDTVGSDISQLGKICAMLTGMYTGGTLNFNALGASLGVNKSLMAMVLAFDMLITVILYFFLLGGGYRLFRKLLPFTDETTPAFRHQLRQMPPPVTDVENYHGMTSRDNLPGMLVGLLLSLSFLAVGCALSYLLWRIGWIAPDPDEPDQPVLNEMVIILTVTTLSVIASFSDRIRNLPKTFELGMLFILLFSVILASLFDWRAVQGSTLLIGLLVLMVVVGAMLFHLLFCRLFRVSGDLYSVSLIALLCSPPFVPPVIGAMGNKKVLVSGIVIGLIGYAVGTYLGVGVALLLHAV